jgi:hypothetical protein
MTDGLVEWLRAQLDEDERLAREALHADAVQPGTWTTEHHNSEHHNEPNRCHIAEDRSGHYWTVASEVFIPNAEHIANFDPARVLAEVESKRLILELCEQSIIGFVDSGERELGVDTLRLLALPYQDRPGYLEQWRP